ncbi:MAG: DUF72 domain-containing protein [Desulfuromonadaceae bacterium]|nr:DUF72 domain-containing protein [Desulfuromonadaceae bacterium]
MTRQSKGNVHIGTSGWHFGHWRGTFYPNRLPPREMLHFYAGRLQATEINNSFYRLPDVSALENWRDTVPEDFVFAVKASRFITHMKKLKDPSASLGVFLERIQVLGRKLGPVLFQLPPRWRCDSKRLRNFLKEIPSGWRCAFEFRDESWLAEEVFAALSEAGAAFCIFDLDGCLSPLTVTADFVYLRLHGPGGAYQGSYDDEALTEWARRIDRWAAEGRDVFCFFDNDQSGYAPLNALALQRMLTSGSK